MTRINAAACVSPINLIGLVLLATPRQSMGEADLARQLELYASLLRQAPYSPQVWVTSEDGAAMIRYGESLGILRRQPHELGDVLHMTEEHSILTSYFRNNALHLLLMPSLLACAFLSNADRCRARTCTASRAASTRTSRTSTSCAGREDELPAVVDELLEDLLNHGLLTASDDRSVWHRPPAESPEAVQLSVLAQATVPILERYYLALALLLKAGSGRLTQEALERQCQLMAQRMALLYEINSPEFFDRALFRNFLEHAARAAGAVGHDEDEKLEFEPRCSRRSSPTRRSVLNEQVRNSILQVVHR